MSGLGKTLFGGETSGTPLETRGLTSSLADMFNRQVQTGQLGKLGMDSLMSGLGFDFGGIGLGDALRGGLQGPEFDINQFAEQLFAGRLPGQDIARRRATQAGRSGFGGLGGRFAGNAQGAEALNLGQLEQGFDQNFIESLLGAGQLQLGQQQAVNQLSGNLVNAFPGLQQAALAPFQLAAGFGAPGAPNFQQGIFGDILGAGGNLAASFINPAAAVGQGGNFLSGLFGGGGQNIGNFNAGSLFGGQLPGFGGQQGGGFVGDVMTPFGMQSPGSNVNPSNFFSLFGGR